MTKDKDEQLAKMAVDVFYRQKAAEAREEKELERFRVAVRRATAHGIGSVRLVGLIREVSEEEAS